MESWLIILFVIIPLFTAFLIPLAARLLPWLGRTAVSGIMLFLVALTIHILFQAPGTVVYMAGGWMPVDGIPVAIYLVLDGLSLFLLLIINLLGFLSAFYAISYMRRYTGEKYFYTLFCLMIAGMNGVVLAGDLFNLYVFLEISVISSYALVAFGVEKTELEASYKYQVLGGMASLFVLFGIIMIYWRTKTLNIADISMIMQGAVQDPFNIFIQLFLIAGFGIKAALIPFHAWLPDAHSSAPSPISAMLSGVLIKAVGVYVIIRLFFNMFPPDLSMAVVFTTVGALSMIIGVLLAIGQWDLKRLLAYHSISQMGYVVTGIGMGMILLARGGGNTVAALAIGGGLFHMINHAIFKGLLFLNAGAIEYAAGTRDMTKMGGLARYMPVTLTSSFSASMAISGIPPFNGFFSKLIIIIAAVQGGFYLLASIAIIAGILTLASFMKFQRYAFYNKPEPERPAREVPVVMRASMITLAALCLLLSLLVVPGVRQAVLEPAVNVLVQSTEYAVQVLNHGSEIADF
jgi:multicomponent Na+:H+ antiporter subunit D